MLFFKKLPERQFFFITGRKVRMPPFGGISPSRSAVPGDEGFTESRSRRDHGHVPVRVRLAFLKGQDRPFPQMMELPPPWPGHRSPGEPMVNPRISCRCAASSTQGRFVNFAFPSMTGPATPKTALSYSMIGTGHEFPHHTFQAVVLLRSGKPPPPGAPSTSHPRRKRSPVVFSSPRYRRPGSWFSLPADGFPPPAIAGRSHPDYDFRRDNLGDCVGVESPGSPQQYRETKPPGFWSSAPLLRLLHLPCQQ